MKRFYKKALAAALCLALTLSCMPLSALSETPQITQPAVSGTAENLSEEAVPITEITEKRTGDSKTFLMSDGTYMNAVYPEQIHYNDNGKYKEIDNSFVYSDNNGKGHYKNKANSVSVNLPESYNNGYIELSDKNGYINFKLVGTGNKKLKIKNNKINNSKNDPTVITKVNSSVTYKSLKKNVDVQYDMNGSILKETIILHKKTKESFIFELKTSAENVLVNSDKSISFYNSDGAEIYRMDSPFMEDSNGIYSNEIEVSLVKEDNGYILIYKPDYEWLSDKSRSYPVKIDPTVRTEQDLNSVETTYYTQNNYDLSAYGTLYAGFEKGQKGRVNSALKFTLPQIGATDIILKAVVGLAQIDYTHVGNPDNIINAHEITSGWTSPKSPGVQGNPPGYDPKIIDYAVVNEGTTYEFVTWDITSVAKKWYENPNSNNGILIKAADESKWSLVRFSDTLHANMPSSARPIMILQYMDSKGLTPYQDYTSLSGIYRSSFDINNYTGNLVYSYTDIDMPGTRSGINITHYYNSADYDDNDVVSRDFSSYAGNKKAYYGKGFRTNLNHQLSDKTISGKTYKVHTDSSGTKHYFELVAGSNPARWEYEFDKNIYIAQNSNGDYYIQYEDGSQLIFWQYTRRLFKIIDSNGNTLTLEYANDVYYPTAVTDDLGQRTILSYTNDRLTSITDTAGRQTKYEYYSDGRLHYITDHTGGVTELIYSNGYLSEVRSPENQSKRFEYGAASQRTGLKKVIKATEYSGNSEGGYFQFNYLDGETVITDRDGKSISVIFDHAGRAVTKTDRDMNVISTKYVQGGEETDSLGITSKKIDTKVAKEFSEKYVENFLTNSSCETDEVWGQSNWGTGTYSFTTSFATDEKLSGSRSIKVQVNAPTDTLLGRCAQVYNLKPGIYTFSAYAKTQNISSESGAMLYISTFDSTWQCQKMYFSDALSGTKDWQRMSITFEVPSGAVETRVHCGINKSSGTVWFDNLQLEKGAVANRYNYVQNGSFEVMNGSMPKYWQSYNFNGSSASINDRGERNGKGLTIAGSNGTGDRYYRQFVKMTVKKGQLISFSAWAKAQSIPINGTREFAIDISYNYVNNGVSGREYLRFDFNPETERWQYLKDSMIAKGDTEEVEITLLYRDNANTAYFDDVQLFVGEDGQSYEYYTAADGAGLEGKLKYSYSGTKRTAYTYGDNARNLTKITYPDNTSEEYTYDSHKRIVTAKDRSGIPYAYTYDAYGNALTMTVGTSPLNMKVTNEYANGNMLSKTVDSNGGTTLYNYHPQKGTLASITDPNGNVTEYTYDSADRITKVTSGGATASYTYDRYNLKSITTGSGTEYTLEYDSFKDDVSRVKVGGHTLIEHMYAGNNGRLIRSDYGNEAYTEKVYKSSWDDTVTGIKYNGTEKYSYSYDSAGNIGVHTDLENGDTYRYEYDETGRMTGVYSSEKYHTQIRYNEYDEPVRQESRIQMSGKYAQKYYSDKEWKVDIGYNSKKQVEYAHFGYGKHSYTYDALGRLVKTERWDNMYNTTSTVSEVSYGTNPDGSASLQVSQYKTGGKTYDYTYDANGNILTVSVDGELKESYTYDALGQLVRENSAAQNKTIVYSYDSGGNILSRTEYAYTEGVLGEPVNTAEYTYGDTGWKDLLTGYNGENITYDEIGNPLTYRGAELSWKNGRQLATYSGKGYNISYKYTDGGIRKNKTVNGQTTEYLLNGGEILQERRGNGDILTFARDESGSIIAVEYYSETTDLISYYYYIKNLQGDVIGISDREGNTVAEYRYDSWGRLLSVRDGAGNDISENAGHIANINPIRYRGYYYDSETGFYYLQSRYYDPETGRFLNADGYVSTGQGMTGNNMFAYCGNNPVMYTDPSGELFGFAILGEILLKGLAVTAGILIIASVINAATPEGKRAGSEIGKSLYSAASSVAAAGSEFAKSFAKDYNVGKSDSRSKDKTIIKTKPPVAKTYYHVTTLERALSISSTKKMEGSIFEAGHVYAWKSKPSSYAIKNSGAHFGVIISFKTNAPFIKDIGIDNPIVNLFGPVVSAFPGPITVWDVRIVGMTQ